MLVDIRHEATHNELPSLALLRLAAGHALDWLRASYWQRQAEHVAAEHARIRQLLQARYHTVVTYALFAPGAVADARGSR